MVQGSMKGLVAVLLLTVSGLAAAAQVNINTADAKSLDKELAGVGKVTASAIVAERARGEFKDMKDLQKRVKGFGKKGAATNAERIRFHD